MFVSDARMGRANKAPETKSPVVLPLPPRGPRVLRVAERKPKCPRFQSVVSDRPVPPQAGSQYKIFTRSLLRLQNTNRCPENGLHRLSASTGRDDVLRHHRKPVKGPTHVARLRAQKHLDRRRETQHPSSNTPIAVRRVSSSTPLPMRSRRPPRNTRSIPADPNSPPSSVTSANVS